MATQAQMESCVFETKALLEQQLTLDVRVIENLRWMHQEKAYLAYGSPSFHRFCVDVLGMSDDSAWRRIHAAKLVEQFPEVVKPLIEKGEVHLTGLALLDRVITPANGKRLIEEAAGKSTTEIKAIVAREAPEAGVSLVRKLPRKQLSEDTWQFHAVMKRDTNERLQRIADMHGNSDPDSILDAALEAYEELLRVKKQKALKRAPKLATKRAPTEVVAATLPLMVYEYRALAEHGAAVALEGAASMRRQSDRLKRRIPRAIERFVRERDGHQCTYVGIGGRRCCAKSSLEVHHLIAVALGGMTVVWNLALLCRAHNTYQAEVDLGEEWANGWRKSA